MTRDPLAAVRPEIRVLNAYRFETGPTTVAAKLDFNESPADVPAAAKAVALAALGARRFALYPEFGAPRLRAALAANAGLAPEQVVPSNGSGEAILAALSVFAGCGGALLPAPPVFSLYFQMAAIVGARVATVPLAGDGYRLDEEAFLAAAAEGERTVPLLCSPNNPTGGTLSRAFVRRLCAVAGVVLLDQAYVDFAEGEDDLLPFLPELPNLVIFRTLSKAYSVAGLRVGYAAARPDVADEIGKAILPFSVDVGAEEIALAVLAEREEVRARCRAVAAERERVAAALRSLGAKVAPSRANFLFLVPPGGDGARACRGLRARGVLVRDLASVAPGAIRVSIGTPEENDLFLASLKEVL
ncbi:MAG TPA: aminotransferase class I/II-fold pyridoxal phosphate-dependent enzyme [Thermoanaerobaculia bacterium]|nr:aminotransferase class I/II-fold pyridoxal phosphate-dependent enzyme [Thermoanaerobaculia bacterium]